MNTSTHNPDFEDIVQHGKHCSRYLNRLLEAEPLLLPWLREQYQTPCSADEIRGWLDAMPAGSEAELSRALRDLRKRVMLKILMRDLGGLADLDEVMRCMTALAELAVQRALGFAARALVEQYGQPVGAESGTGQELLVIGMGKLGGGELNVSSDIDLIFVYAEDGETNGSRTLNNHEFFSRVGRKLINLINELTAHGYVFRVDMRLRPYGDSGALVMSFAALEEYLVSQGREWERYAWIKARVIAPANAAATSELMALAQPFVFRKYLDYGAFESMRKLHAQIRQEVERRDRAHNIKLGPGGIREIEFIAQVFQLIRGGRDATLRIRPTRAVLHLLADIGQIDAQTAEELDKAYVFLRNLEHRLQYLDDQQTQDIPADESNRALLATGMGYAGYAALLSDLDAHRAHVSHHFSQIFSTGQDEAGSSPLWNEQLGTEALANTLGEQGYTHARELAEQLVQLRNSNRYKQLPEISRARFDKIVPQLVARSRALAQRDVALPRLLKLLENISRRSTYLAFMTEHPQALERLARFAGASEWACNYLSMHPSLLDELLDAREIYRAPDWRKLDAALAARLQEHAGDLEQQMDALRHFKQAQTFQLLAMDLQGLLPLETLSDHLSDLADLILQQVLKLCWGDARKKHREYAQFASDNFASSSLDSELPAFGIIAYGKLGGRELGYDSDLDLIFLFDDEHADAGENYARLAQRINTVLSSYTSAGRLYETDLRLRPNGASGLLVSSTAAFAEYQKNQAWVWEHQALTRARFCAGDDSVGKQFDAIREQVLRQPRDIAALRREVIVMRRKMHDGHPNKSTLFDIKHDSGGMVDIEFMVQFLVLAHAADHPELTANSGNLALLHAAANLNLIGRESSNAVRDIYRQLRRLQHQMRLNNQTLCRVEHGTPDITPVLALWEELLGNQTALGSPPGAGK
ncbi:MAG: bifunctional [glutamate--ammonia ligase]-adenylyl-L-tyrosine phosphorylase/[glutamate--ammonia-ligase] adenylyltransferase [Gallionellaceae bacterium]|nr:MAG: bifunctional [glutamate--ammonia ligase]-adenylyl-L-tyrosine phosphorylase/[glutamate--ammonia-ligase] adenylyltransferase [Gallionellaceae bacterium]